MASSYLLVQWCWPESHSLCFLFCILNYEGDFSFLTLPSTEISLPYRYSQLWSLSEKYGKWQEPDILALAPSLTSYVTRDRYPLLWLWQLTSHGWYWVCVWNESSEGWHWLSDFRVWQNDLECQGINSQGRWHNNIFGGWVDGSVNKALFLQARSLEIGSPESMQMPSGLEGQPVIPVSEG